MRCVWEKIMTFRFEPGKAKYAQVADDLRRRIRSGDLPTGCSLGDIFKMAESYGCSMGTVRHAQSILVAEGLLSEIRHGVATRVLATPSAPQVEPLLERLRRMRKDIDEIIKRLEGDAA